MTQTVSLTLQPEIISVTGTINGIAVTWLKDGIAWYAICDKSLDGQYHVNITAINSLNIVSAFDFTLTYEGLSLITWRTEADVSRVRYLTQKIIKGTITQEEKSEWLSGEMIGAYNYTDLNRVGEAVQFVTQRLAGVGCSVATVGKDDWTKNDIPVDTSIGYYLRDILLIRNALMVTNETPPCPESINNLTYGQANDIEQILIDIDAIITLIMRSWMYAGEVYAGGMY